MDRRRHFFSLIALVLAAAPAAAESQLRTQNFLVHAPNAQIAEQFGRQAEFFRRQKAIEWLGQEMPPWNQPCPLYVKPTMSNGGGATSFDYRNGGYVVLSMNIEGQIERMLNSVLPHEITHTVFAHHFRFPVPRWADEGGSVLSEDDQERARHDQLCRNYLNRPGGKLPLRRLFNLKEYHEVSDVLIIYAEGFSVSEYLVNKSDRKTFLDFVSMGMRGSWDRACQTYYGFQSVEQLEESWLQHLRDTRDIARRGSNPTTVASNNVGRAPATPTGREVVRLTVPPAQPQLDPAGPIARGAAPDERRAPGVIPLGTNPRPTPPAPPAGRPSPPPPVTLGLPEFAPNSQSTPLKPGGPSPVGFQK
ncbi:MAG: hypothetical protein K1X57_00660 [Gemmataceae bacterium]|nr:hypothetical protein [Gemmataceae bacterium]